MNFIQKFAPAKQNNAKDEDKLMRSRSNDIKKPPFSVWSGFYIRLDDLAHCVVRAGRGLLAARACVEEGSLGR